MSNQVLTGRSAETRDRLLRAGVRVFAELGFEPASTRQLASQAGVNLAAIPYHFESKHGLYLAVAEHVATRIGEHMLPAIEAVAAVIDNEDAPEQQLRAALHKVMGSMSRLMIGEPEADAWAAFILREQAQPTEAFDIIYDRVMGRVFDTVSALFARLIGADATDPEVRLQAVTLLGQLMIFRTSRAGVLRSLGWDRYTTERYQLVRAIVVRQTDLLIDAAAAGHG